MDQNAIEEANREIREFTNGFPHFDVLTRQAVSQQRIAEELIRLRILFDRFLGNQAVNSSGPIEKE